MSTANLETLLSWRGRTVTDADGDKLGKLGALYLDGVGQQPRFAGIHTGLFGHHESIVPLDELLEQDGELRLPYDKATLRAAPDIDPGAALTDAEEDAIRAHYDAPGTAGTTDSSPADAVASGDADPDARGSAPAAEVVRSEEEVTSHAGPAVPVERVRLRKVLVTEDVTQVVPRRKEVVQLETDPPPEGTIESVQDAGPADDGPAPA